MKKSKPVIKPQNPFRSLSLKNPKPVQKIIKPIKPFDFSSFIQSEVGKHYFKGDSNLLSSIKASTSKLGIEIRKCSIRISNDLVKKLKWDNINKIAVFHDPDNIIKVLLVPSDSQFAFVKETQSTKWKTEFTWKFQSVCPIERGTKNVTEYEIIEQQKHNILTFEVI